MSRAWQQVALGEVATPIERPEIPRAGTIYRQIGVRLWGEGAYERESIDGSQTKYKTLSRVEADDIIVNKIWARNGSVAVVPEALAGCFGSGEFPTFAPDKTKLYPRWIHWLTKTKGFCEQCDDKSRGTSGKNRIRPERFLEITIPLPPLDEQRRVVAQIEELAAKIEEARGLRRQAVEEAEALVISQHNQLSGSRIKKIADILRLDEDAVTILPNEAYPQVGVRGFGAGLFPKSAVSGMDTTYRTFNRLYEGALVMSQVKAWEGAVAVCGKDLAGMYVSPEYRTFRFDEKEAVAEYFAAIVKTKWFWSRLKDATRGVGARRERTRPEQFLDIELPVPVLSKQQEAVCIFSKLETMRHVQTSTVAEIDAMLPSILDKAFKGKLC